MGFTLILPEGFDEIRAYETPLRGYLSDVFLELEDGRRLPLFFYDPIRLGQDLEANVKLGIPFVAEPGLIILPEVTMAAIHETVARLYEEGYFTRLLPTGTMERVDAFDAGVATRTR